MAKPSLLNILSIADPMLSDNFELIFGSIPGSDNANEPFRVQCRSASKPGMTLEQVTYDLFGHTVEFAGRLTYTHTMSVEYVENYQGTITRALEKWQEIIRSHKSQHGAFKADYTVTADLNIYDQKGGLSLNYRIYNMWPTEVPELAFDGSSATALTVGATFSYDFYEIGNKDITGNGQAKASASNVA